MAIIIHLLSGHLSFKLTTSDKQANWLLQVIPQHRNANGQFSSHDLKVGVPKSSHEPMHRICHSNHNILSWQPQHSVIATTTFCHSNHNILSWQPQHSVIATTAFCHGNHNILSWQPQLLGMYCLVFGRAYTPQSIDALLVYLTEYNRLL